MRQSLTPHALIIDLIRHSKVIPLYNQYPDTGIQSTGHGLCPAMFSSTLICTTGNVYYA